MTTNIQVSILTPLKKLVNNSSKYKEVNIIDEEFFLPLPILADSDKYKPVEKFVNDAISCRTTISKEFDKRKIDEKAVRGYRALMDLLRNFDDTNMLTNVLNALRTSGKGMTLNYISGNMKNHSALIHLYFRLDPFLVASQESEGNKKEKKPTKDDGEKVVKVTEAMVALVDAHLNLMVALVSANSAFLSLSLSSLWRMLKNTPSLPGDCYDENDENDESDENNENDENDENDDETRKNPGDSSTISEIQAKEAHKFDKKKAQSEYITKRNQRLHATLYKILNLVPNGKSEIFKIMSISFPYKLAHINEQISYVKQCFSVLRYVPSIHQKLLGLLIDKCIEMDVEIRINNSGTVSIDENEYKNDGFVSNENEMNGDLNKRNKRKSMEKKRKRQEMEKNESDHVRDMAEKLDSLMYLFFQHLQTSSELSSPSFLFRMIIPLFESIILTTYRSKFVQFILFFLCGLEKKIKNQLSYEEKNDDNIEHERKTIKIDNQVGTLQHHLYREFAATLITIALDSSRAKSTRQSSACYLASFISRFKYVCPSTACESICALLRFSEAYLDAFPTEASARALLKGANVEGDKKDPLVEVHCLFYTICQATFYIMCFRGVECMNHYNQSLACRDELPKTQKGVGKSDSDSKYLDVSRSRWTRLCSSHFQPLRHCLESVRGEFLLLSDKLDLFQPKLLSKLIFDHRNMPSGAKKRLKPIRKKARVINTAATLECTRIRGGVGGLGHGSNPLDSFFPFDPYLLRRSHSFVDPYYSNWKGITSSDDVIEMNHSLNSTLSPKVETTGNKYEIDNSAQYCDEENCNKDDVIEHESTMLDVDIQNDLTDDESLDITQGIVELTECKIERPKEAWIQELRRERALSLTDDCW